MTELLLPLYFTRNNVTILGGALKGSNCLYVHAIVCANFCKYTFPMDAEEEILYEKKTCKEPEFTDIDSDNKDPQLCSHYASDIYNNLRVAEVCACIIVCC